MGEVSDSLQQSGSHMRTWASLSPRALTQLAFGSCSGHTSPAQPRESRKTVTQGIFNKATSLGHWTRPLEATFPQVFLRLTPQTQPLLLIKFVTAANWTRWTNKLKCYAIQIIFFSCLVFGMSVYCHLREPCGISWLRCSPASMANPSLRKKRTIASN